MTRREAIQHLRTARGCAVANLAALEALRTALFIPPSYSLGEEAVREQIRTLDNTLRELGAEGGQ